MIRVLICSCGFRRHKIRPYAGRILLYMLISFLEVTAKIERGAQFCAKI